MKAKKSKQKSKKSYTNKLDKIVSEIVRRQNCYKCGGNNYLQAAHIFSRKNRSVRWDLDNVICLCAGCHFWAHQNPLLFTELIREKYGEEKYELLKSKARAINKFSREELNRIILDYSGYIRAMEAGERLGETVRGILDKAFIEDTKRNKEIAEKS